jgi:hypothetical protein
VPKANDVSEVLNVLHHRQREIHPKRSSGWVEIKMSGMLDDGWREREETINYGLVQAEEIFEINYSHIEFFWAPTSRPLARQ